MAGPEDFAWRTIDKVKVVGKAEAVETVEILGLQGHLSPQQVELCALYHQGLALYRQQRWDKALAFFTASECLEDVFPQRLTTPSRVYMERCALFKATPPGPNWDGTWSLTVK